MNYSELNREKRETNLLRSTVYWAADLAAVAVLAVFVVLFFCDRVTVTGHSMEPVLAADDVVLVNRVQYHFSDPERYDIIVFTKENGSGTKTYVKRVIGLPGETVQIIDGEVYINGELLGENYGAEIIENPGVAAEPITLGDDEYFVLGDNRNNSKDSRYAEVGNIKREDLIGRAFIRIWPLNKFGLLKHQ